jgi:hypothetical protein
MSKISLSLISLLVKCIEHNDEKQSCKWQHNKENGIKVQHWHESSQQKDREHAAGHIADVQHGTGLKGLSQPNHSNEIQNSE